MLRAAEAVLVQEVLLEGQPVAVAVELGRPVLAQDRLRVPGLGVRRAVRQVGAALELVEEPVAGVLEAPGRAAVVEASTLEQAVARVAMRRAILVRQVVLSVDQVLARPEVLAVECSAAEHLLRSVTLNGWAVELARRKAVLAQQAPVQDKRELKVAKGVACSAVAPQLALVERTQLAAERRDPPQRERPEPPDPSVGRRPTAEPRLVPTAKLALETQ